MIAPGHTTRRRRTILTTTVLVALVTGAVAFLASDRQANVALAGEPPLQAAAYDPYQSELLAPYGELRRAIDEEDDAALLDLAFASDDYSAYLAASEVAGWEQLPAVERLRALERALELRVHDSLRRAENRALQLERARLARAAQRQDVAVAAYREALPLTEAREGLAELESDPYRLAAAYQGAGLHSAALAALGELTAPSIEATSLRVLGRYEGALDAYQRWLVEDPGNDDVALWIAWCLYYLGRDDQAASAFAALGSAGDYGLGLLANRAGDIDAAIDFMRRTGRADVLWLASGILEARDRYSDVVPIYLELARGSSSYADDSAYRAYVLAQRLDLPEVAAQARELLPEGNFFAMLLGSGPLAPDPATAPASAEALASTAAEQSTDATSTELTGAARALALAAELYGVHEEQAAVGELLFALRQAEAAGTATDVIALAEMLQSMDEYRNSVAAARELLARGHDEIRVWRLAYPPAWPELVLAAAEDEGVEPGLIWAVMRQESAFSEVAVSVANAQGLMQVIPSTWDWIAELRSEPPGDPFEIGANVAYGATYLAWLENYFDGDIELVIASYNGGQGYVRRLFESEWVNLDKDEFYREIDRPETREYLQRVYENLSVYRVLYPSLAAVEEQRAVLAAVEGPTY